MAVKYPMTASSAFSATVVDGKITAENLSGVDKSDFLVYDVRDYGYVDTWNYDNTPKIQEALDAAEAAGGGIVKLPASKRIMITSLVVGSYVSLVGGDNFTRLHHKSLETGSMIKTKVNAVECTFENLWLQGTVTTEIGLEIGNATGAPALMTYHQLNNVRYENISTGSGLKIGPYIRGAIVTNTIARNCGVGVNWNTNDSQMRGADISQCNYEGLKITGGASMFSDIKVWYCGKITLTDSTKKPPGILVAASATLMSNIYSQENHSIGVEVYAEGKTFESITINGLIFDSDNLAGNNSGAFKAYNMKNSSIRGAIRKSGSMGSNVLYYGVSNSGPNCTGNTIEVSVESVATKLTSNCVMTDNRYVVNGAVITTL